MSASHHAPIVDAVEAGDAAQAVKVLQDHMMLGADRLASPVGSPWTAPIQSTPALERGHAGPTPWPRPTPQQRADQPDPSMMADSCPPVFRSYRPFPAKPQLSVLD